VGAVFTTTAFAPRLPAGLPAVLLDDAPRTAHVLADDVTKTVDLGTHHGLSLEGERDAPGRDEEAAVVYTSALSGTPLGAVLTHANLLANAHATVDALALVPQDHLLALLPFSHLFGFTVTAAGPLLAGARVTTMPRFNPVRAVEALAGDVTVIVGVPSVFHGLLSVAERRGIDLHGGALRLCVCGGAELPVDLQERWARATGVALRQGYGLTEAAPVCLFNRVDRPNVPGALGYPYPGVDVAVFPPADYSAMPPTVDAAAAPLTPGAPGEICVRGENVSPGYLGRAGTGLPRRGRWLCTGDLGVANVDGTVSFLGLLKPMFTRNGFKIYPRELERAVRELPGVQRAEVDALPDAAKEHAIRLRVSGVATVAEVREWCQRRLGACKQPSVVEVAPPTR
jgi:long-chain acyl-CoA synthetase